MPTSKLTTPTLDEVRGEIAKLLDDHGLRRYHSHRTRTEVFAWGFRGEGSLEAEKAEAFAATYPLTFAYIGTRREYLPLAELLDRVGAKMLRRVEVAHGLKRTAKFEFHRSGLVTVRTARGLRKYGPG